MDIKKAERIKFLVEEIGAIDSKLANLQSIKPCAEVIFTDTINTEHISTLKVTDILLRTCISAMEDLLSRYKDELETI